MSTIHMAFASDRHYSRPLAVTLASILASAGADDAFFFHIIDQGLSEECRDRIARLRDIRDFSVQYLDLPLERVEEMLRDMPEELVTRHGSSRAVFGRIFLPEMLPELDKVLYLDCDLVVLDSLKTLWDTPFEGKYAVRARDAIEYQRSDEKEVARFIESLGIREGNAYFNSGVMLLNLEKARRRNMPRRFFTLFRQFSHVIRTSDQDVFNILFQNDCILVNSMWNFPAPMSKWSPDLTYANPGFRPKIIHYTTPDKPWKAGSRCAHGDIYYRYAGMTGWTLPPESGGR